MPHCSLHAAACCIYCGLPVMCCAVFAQKKGGGKTMSSSRKVHLSVCSVPQCR